jgi:hypothetical protein
MLVPDEDSGWLEHIPFANALVEMIRPQSYVELGVHTGASYLAFCQAVASQGLSCACYGIDTFKGDEHAGNYESDVEKRLRARHDPAYGAFSRLISSTFDEAAAHLSDGSVDLLHIDGLHTYEAVAHDFQTWLPKLSLRGVVLFHDTNVRERGFGVWRLWEELSGRYPYFAFKHGHGLGLLAVGKDVPEELAELLTMDAEEAERVGELFYLLGNRITLQVQNRRFVQEREALQKEQQAVRRFTEENVGMRQRLEHAEAEILHKERMLAEKERQIQELQNTISVINHSLSFRLGMGATAPLRWVADKLGPGSQKPT